MTADWSPLWLSLRYAGISTLVATAAALPLAWLLAQHRFGGVDLLNAVANLPLILPPAVLVYYLISRLGRWRLQFSWRAAAAVSAVYTMPLLLRMMRAGLTAADHACEDAARVLGAGEWRTFYAITLPSAWPAVAAALLAGFARSLADFLATAVVALGAGTGWIGLAAVIALAALYLGSRMERAQASA